MVAWTAPNKSKAPVPAERDVYANEKPAAYTKSAAAEIQLPYRIGECCVKSAELELFSTKFVVVVSTISILRTLVMSQSATVPEKIRTRVNVAGSTLLSLNAARHKSELLAKAIIASSVSMKIRAALMEEDFQFQIWRQCARGLRAVFVRA
jgi:hypothetical protein